MSKVKAVPVKAFMIETDGKELGLFISKSEWNGMCELEKIERTSGKLIVMPDSEVSLIGLFEQFTSDPKEIHIISGQPEIIAKIKGCE